MRYGRECGPLAIAHRGGAALAPENTLRAFATSVSLGVRYLETDVRMTRDGMLVALHDETLDRVTDATGRVVDHSWDTVRALTVDGEPIPTLREVLETFPDARVTVDLKDLHALASLGALLRRPGVAERVCVAGAWDGWLARVRAEAPGVSTALGWRSLTTLVSCARTGVRPPRGIARAEFAHVPLRLGRVPVFAERLVGMAHYLGLKVICWTVDGIITARPALLREVPTSRGEWTPMSPAPTGSHAANRS